MTVKLNQTTIEMNAALKIPNDIRIIIEFVNIVRAANAALRDRKGSNEVKLTRNPNQRCKADSIAAVGRKYSEFKLEYKHL